MHRSSLLCFLVTLLTVLVISSSLLPASATPDGLSGDAEPGEAVQISDNAERQYFNLSNFRGPEQHDFSAQRDIYILKHGGVIVETVFILKIAEDADDSFNAINLTITNDEFDSMVGYRISNKTGDTTGFSVVEDRQANNTILSILMPAITPGTELEFVFAANYGTYIKQNPSKIQQLERYYAIFNHSFHPWVSIPLSNYSIYLEISGSAGDENPEIDTDSIEPAEIMPENVTTDTMLIELPNVTLLPTLNLSLLDDSLGYNLTTLQDIEFIPAYDPQIAGNLTLFLSFNYSTNFPPVQYDSFHRTVEIDQWKRMTVTEEITIRNLAVNGSEFSIEGNLDGFVITIPAESEYLSGHDAFGNLSVIMFLDVQYGSDRFGNELHIIPRIKIPGNDTYRFTFSYTQELKDILDGDILGTQRLKIWSSSLFNWTVREFSLKIIFPFGSSYKSISGISKEIAIESEGSTGTSLFKLMHRSYRRWSFTNPTHLGSVEIKVSYDAGFLWVIGSPLFYSFGFLLLGLLYIGVRSVRFGEDIAAEVAEIPFELIESFVKTYEEKTAIRERLQRLERQRRSGKATDREYQKARTILQNKLTAIERDLVGETRSLSKKGRVYEGFTHSIEVAEAEREDVLTNLERLEKRKTGGRIGKDAYRRLKTNYERRLKKANNNLDRVLIELRSLIPE